MKLSEGSTADVPGDGVCLSDGILLLAGQRSGVAGLSGPGANNHNHTHYCLVIISSHHQADTEAVIWISILSIISIISRRHYQLVVPRLSHVPGLTVTQDNGSVWRDGDSVR